MIGTPEWIAFFGTALIWLLFGLNEAVFFALGSVVYMVTSSEFKHSCNDEDCHK